MENNSSSKRYKEKARTGEEIKLLNQRLNRIVGQLGGIKTMIEENRYCGDLLIQVAAAASALKSFGYAILEEHLADCVTGKIKRGDEEIIGETMELIKQLS